MIYLNGHLARPLDAALSAASRLSVLRELARARNPLTGRTVARLAGVNHQSAALALEALRVHGLVRRSESGWALDRRRWLVSQLLLPMLEKEAEHADAVKDEIVGALKGRALAAFLEGSAARGALKPGEPLKLVVVQGPKALRDALDGLAARLEETWGVTLETRVVSPKAKESTEMLWQLLPVEGPATLSARA